MPPPIPLFAQSPDNKQLTAPQVPFLLGLAFRIGQKNSPFAAFELLRLAQSTVYLDNNIQLSSIGSELMISQTADYALRAIVCMANQPDSARTTEQIANESHVPPGYLSKVLQTLGRANLVRSRRGLGGGFSLVKPVSEMSVLDVINAVDPIRRITECPLGNDGHGMQLCPLHQRLDAAIALIEETFRGCSIADLLREQEGGPPLCQSKNKDANDEGNGSPGIELGRHPEV